MEEAGLCCPRYVFTHRPLGIQHHSKVTNNVGGFNYNGASLNDFATQRGFLQVVRSSEHKQFSLNCRRFDAHQPLTSMKQSLRVDINWGTSDSAAFPACHRRTECRSYLTSWHVTFSAYSMNRFGSLTELSGTPYFSVSTADSLPLVRTICARSSTESACQSRALPLTPKRRLKTAFTIWWSTVSKIADKSSNMRAPTWPWSIAINMLLTTQMMAVCVEWNGR